MVSIEALLQRVQQAETETDRQWILLELQMSQMPSELVSMLWAAAIPHFFDLNILKALRPELTEQAENLYESLKSLTFVEEFPDGKYNIHELTRNVLLKRLWQNNQEGFRELSQRAADYFFEAGTSSLIEVEFCYHEIINEDHRQAGRLIDRITGWWDYHQVDRLRLLVENIAEVESIERLGILSQGFLLHLRGLLAMLAINYEDAEFFLLQSQSLYESIEIKNPRYITTLLRDIGNTKIKMGIYQEATIFCEKALQIGEKQIGQDHIDTATSLNNLAALYKSLGRYKEAETLYIQSLQTRREQLGNDHPDTASSLNNLAGLYINLGRYKEAEPLYIQSLQIRREKLGDAHPDTASSLNDLAVLYTNLGRYKEAKPLCLQSLQIRREQLGENHPDTGESLNNLAKLYQRQKRYKEAIPLLGLLARLILPALIASLGITAAIAFARNIGWLQNLELTAFDRMVRLQPASDLDDRFLIVEIRDADLQAFQQVPLTDATIAQALATIQKHNPRVIGLDIYRDIPNPPGTAILKTQLNQENVILIKKLTSDTAIPRPPEIAARSGFNIFVIDPDNVQRRNMLAVRTDKTHLSFGLLVAQAYLGAAQYPVELDGVGLSFGPHYFPAINVNSGGYQLPDSEAKGWQTLLTFASEPNIAASITISDLLAGNFDPKDIEDKIVLLGSTAESQKDSFLTPYSASRTDGHMTPGVFLHAQAIQQILKTVDNGNHFFAFWTEGQEMVWIFGWACFGGASTWLFYRTRLFITVSVLGSLGLVGGGYGLFLMNVWVPIAAAAIALVASWSSVLAYRLFYEEKYDVLTRLPNGRYFLEQLSKINHSLPSGNSERQIAVLAIDINRFKSINESYGHYYGDTVLTQIVKRISDLIEDEILLARMGANEFALLIKSPKLKQEVIDIIHVIEKSLNEPFFIEQKQHYLTCSTGVAFYRKDEQITPEALWLKAHTAMNRAKQSHKNQYKIFAEGMQTQSINRLTIESNLRQAIANQEFELLYQPIFSLKTDTLKGFEALVRWNSPSRGVVSPNDFINIAEETDLIIPISQWVLEEGCRQFKEWQNELGLDASITISINLSSRQFSQNNLKSQVKQILDSTGLDPSALKLEITESTVMDDIEESAKMLKDLKALNVRLSVDDFGTVYSSLSYLSTFPIDTLKIDRSFVDKIQKGNDNLAVPNALVMLGHSLNMDIIAEGIETVEQLEILRKIGCEFGQGFYFSKPLNKTDATTFVKRWSHNKFDACLAANVEEL